MTLHVKREPKHLLVDILAISILAVLSGADNMVAVETIGRSETAMFRDVFGVAPWYSLSRYLFKGLGVD